MGSKTMADDVASLGGAELSANQDCQPCENRDLINRVPTDENHMAAIRALMIAVAKHNSIQIPAEALPVRPQISTDETVSTRGRYDSDKTINYQLRQRPTAATCSTPA
jgi:hypothetical protein